MKLAVPKLKVECLRPKEIEKYDYERIKLSLNEKFSKYRDYKERLDIIESRIESGLSNDNLSVFSSNISNPTENKVEQRSRYIDYVDEIEKVIDLVIKILTEDEITVLRYSLLSNYNDNDIAEIMHLYKNSYFQRKKSCYIKVAKYFGLDYEF